MTDNDSNKTNGDAGSTCMYCGRSLEGKPPFVLPGGVNLCTDCMRKAMGEINEILPGVREIMEQAPSDFEQQIRALLTGRNGQHPTGAGAHTPPLDHAGSEENGDGQAGDAPPPVALNTEKPDAETEEKPDETSPDGSASGGFFGLPIFSSPDFLGMFNPSARTVRKKKARPKPEEVEAGLYEYEQLDITDMPEPHRIKEALDRYVVGQDHAKKVISVAVYNHYKRVRSEEAFLERPVGANLISDDPLANVEIEKSNILLIGPTGSGKTYLVRTLARLLNVPLAITDATSLTEAGYIGDDIESVVSKLLAAADNDVERAERGIVFIDEIDKLAKKTSSTTRDVSGESVQQGLLKLLEGSEIEVPVGASSKNAMVPMEVIDTRNILFICGGAFPGLEDVIKERLTKKSAMGFVSELKDRFDDEESLLSSVTPEDLRRFGLIPEFIGRLPIIGVLDPLNEEMLVRILKEPQNAILKQYQKLLKLDEVALSFEDEALVQIARQARERDLGARALRAVIEELMLDIMYEIPKDGDIGEVIITKDYVCHQGGPRIIMRGA